MTLDQIEMMAILTKLREMKYNRTHTAAALDIGVRTLQRKLLKWGMQEVFSDAGLYSSGFLEDSAPTPSAIYEAMNMEGGINA